MPQFDFYQDTRIRTWERCHFKVEAESYEAAVAIIKNFCDCDVNNHEEEVEFGPLEILFEHSEKSDPERNEGRATIRIYAEDDTPIIDNAPFGTDTSGAAKETKTIGRQDNRKNLPEEKTWGVFLYSEEYFLSDVSDREIVERWRQTCKNETSTPVENLTPDEFAHRLNEGGLIAGYKVRFIHY